MSNDMSKTKHTKGIHEFLEQSGVLESNDEEFIKKAREAYWRGYHREYKRIQRGKVREHRITLEKREEAFIEREADKYCTTISQFIKDAAFAYMHKSYLPISNENLVILEQQLSHVRTLLDGFGNNSEAVKSALSLIERIELLISQNVTTPPLLDDLVRATLSEKPFYLKTLKTIIAEYDY
jgi:hypothetical protein